MLRPDIGYCILILWLNLHLLRRLVASLPAYLGLTCCCRMSDYGVPVVKSSIVKRQSSSYSVGNDGDKVLGPFGLQPEQMDGKQ